MVPYVAWLAPAAGVSEFCFSPREQSVIGGWLRWARPLCSFCMWCLKSSQSTCALPQASLLLCRSRQGVPLWTLTSFGVCCSACWRGAVSSFLDTVWWFKILLLDFPDGPVVKTPRFYCRGHGFDPWLGKFHMPRWCGR